MKELYNGRSEKALNTSLNELNEPEDKRKKDLGSLNELHEAVSRNMKGKAIEMLNHWIDELENNTVGVSTERPDNIIQAMIESLIDVCKKETINEIVRIDIRIEGNKREVYVKQKDKQNNAISFVIDYEKQIEEKEYKAKYERKEAT